MSAGNYLNYYSKFYFLCYNEDLKRAKELSTDLCS